MTLRSLTFEEFERLPEQAEPGKCELLDGEVIELLPGDLEHANFSEHIHLAAGGCTSGSLTR